MPRSLEYTSATCSSLGPFTTAQPKDGGQAQAQAQTSLNSTSAWISKPLSFNLFYTFPFLFSGGEGTKQKYY